MDDLSASGGPMNTNAFAPFVTFVVKISVWTHKR